MSLTLPTWDPRSVLPRSSVLIIGPRGCGKSCVAAEMVEQMWAPGGIYEYPIMVQSIHDVSIRALTTTNYVLVSVKSYMVDQDLQATLRGVFPRMVAGWQPTTYDYNFLVLTNGEVVSGNGKQGAWTFNVHKYQALYGHPQSRQLKALVSHNRVSPICEVVEHPYFLMSDDVDDDLP